MWGWAPEFIWGPLFLCLGWWRVSAVVCPMGVFLSGVALCYPRGVIKKGGVGVRVNGWVTMGPVVPLVVLLLGKDG